MPPLHRHQLAHLSAAGWQEVLAMPWDADASACLQHWAAHALPLVSHPPTRTGFAGLETSIT